MGRRWVHRRLVDIGGMSRPADAHAPSRTCASWHLRDHAGMQGHLHSRWDVSKMPYTGWTGYISCTVTAPLLGERKVRAVPLRSSAYSLGRRLAGTDHAERRLSLKVTSSLQLLQSLRAMRAMRAMRALHAMHAMQTGRAACNDATTWPIVTGPSSWVIGESSLLIDCRCTRGCNDDLVISH
jgi:hypothetical protein